MAARAPARCRRCSSRLPFPPDGGHCSSSIEAEAASMARAKRRPSRHCLNSRKARPPSSAAECSWAPCPHWPKDGLSDLLPPRSAPCRRRWAPTPGLQGGGAYMSPLVAGALDWLSSLGLAGIGQSSWGPTGFAFIASEQAGRGLLDEGARPRRSRMARLPPRAGAYLGARHREALMRIIYLKSAVLYTATDCYRPAVSLLRNKGTTSIRRYRALSEYPSNCLLCCLLGGRWLLPT